MLWAQDHTCKLWNWGSNPELARLPPCKRIFSCLCGFCHSGSGLGSYFVIAWGKQARDADAASTRTGRARPAVQRTALKGAPAAFGPGETLGVCGHYQQKLAVGDLSSKGTYSRTLGSPQAQGVREPSLEDLGPRSPTTGHRCGWLSRRHPDLISPCGTCPQ